MFKGKYEAKYWNFLKGWERGLKLKSFHGRDKGFSGTTKHSSIHIIKVYTTVHRNFISKSSQLYKKYLAFKPSDWLFLSWDKQPYVALPVHISMEKQSQLKVRTFSAY